MKFLALHFLLFLCVNIAHACDYCGVFMGVRPNERAGRIEAYFRYRNYQGYVRLPEAYSPSVSYNANPAPQSHPLFRTSHDPALHQKADAQAQYRRDDRNFFMTYELRATHFFHPRWSVTGVLPYHQNSLCLNQKTQTGGGLGDATLILNHFLLYEKQKAWKYNLQLHGGIKLPTGRYVPDGASFAENSHLQAGTGSYDFITGSTFTARYKKLGSATNLLYRINTPNYYGYRFANSFNLTHHFFYHYNRPLSNVHLFPACGVYYENSNGEFWQNNWQPGTGGQIVFASVALDGQFGTKSRFGFTSALQLPMWQDLLGVQLGSGGRIILGLIYNFSEVR